MPIGQCAPHHTGTLPRPSKMASKGGVFFNIIDLVFVHNHGMLWSIKNNNEPYYCSLQCINAVCIFIVDDAWALFHNRIEVATNKLITKPFYGGLGQPLGWVALALDQADPLIPYRRRWKRLHHGGGLSWMQDVAHVAYLYYSYIAKQGRLSQAIILAGSLSQLNGATR